MAGKLVESEKSKVKQYSALIVDDSALIRNVSQMLLKKHGFETKVVENGKEAIDIFISGNSFDVIIMDMEMPLMDGIQATKELRTMGVKSKIFGLTSSDSKSAIQEFIEAGLDEYFPKPLDQEKVDKILKHLHLKD